MSKYKYSSLNGESLAYPPERPYAFLKLFAHAWNFGRFDLGVLLLEWISFLIFTAFITVRAAGFIHWDFVFISIPLYIAIGLGCMRTAFWYVTLACISSIPPAVFSDTLLHSR